MNKKEFKYYDVHYILQNKYFTYLEKRFRELFIPLNHINHTAIEYKFYFTNDLK